MKTVEITEGTEVEISGMSVRIKGNKGELSRDFNDPRFNTLVKIEKNGSKVSVSAIDDKKAGAMAGTIAAHIRNMITGVSRGFRYEMKIVYTHFPMTITQNGDEIQIKNFFGEKSIRSTRVIGDTKINIGKDTITLTGPAVEDVSQTAANIERACKLSKRDRRVFQDGIYMVTKGVDK